MPMPPTAPPNDESIASLFLGIATTLPQSVALQTAHRTVSYGELLQRGILLAAALRHHGVGPGVLVGILLPRSVDAVVAVLGTLLAGGTYVPIDPTYPVARQQLLLSDSEVSVVVTACASTVQGIKLQGCTVIELDALNAVAAPSEFQPATSPSVDPLYVLYTSGSTGRPNGVCGSHAATLNRLRWGWATFPFAPQTAEVVAHRSSLNFVDSVVEIFSGLLAGVPTALLHPEETADLGRLLTTLRALEVTRLTVVPSVLAALLRTAPDLQAALPKLRLWTCSGEELPLALLQQFRAAHPLATLVNIYGSTEVTADVTYAVFAPGKPLPSERVPIGMAMANAELLILDEDKAPVPDGQSGELYVGGPVLSRGYLRRPIEQSRRFVAHPQQPSQRLFRTGDRVRRGIDGQLYYLGRQDNQVKLRGVRIELEEIERLLIEPCQGLQELAVVLHQEPAQTQSPRLCAFFSPVEFDPAQLRAAAQRLLPVSMHPTEYVGISSLPLLPNGKLDRQALALLIKQSTRVLPPEQQPQTRTERRIADLYASVLGRGPVARMDTLLTLGGDSLALAELLIAIDREFCAHKLESKHLYQQPLHQLATWIDNDTPPMQDWAGQLEFEVVPWSATVLSAEDGIQLAVEADAEREPLTAASELTHEDDLPFVTPIVRASLADHLSFIAREPGSKRVLGFCMAHDYCSPAGVALNDAPPRLRPSLVLIAELEDEFVRLHGEPAPGQVVQLSLTGTIPSVSGYEITRRLEQESLTAARSRGYRQAVTICTHRVTAVQAERTGFVRVATRDYATYEYEGRRVFCKIADIHQEAVLFVKQL